MAESASCFVEMQFACAVEVQEVFHVAGGLQKGSVLDVAILAGEGQFDLGMAHQAIGHLGHSGVGDLVRLLQASMTRFAGISGVEMASNVAGRLQVILLIDGLCQDRRDVSHLEVQGVAELVHTSRRLGGNGGDFVFGMAVQADLFGGQQVVLGSSAGCRGGVTFPARQSHA
jgi:hypothetical protein